MTDKNQVQALKGFRDFLGSEARKRSWLIQKISSVFNRFGFEPLETPTLEYESLLLGKYGAEAEKLIYRFEDNGGRRVAMRYDQTVPTTRIIAQYRNELVFPYKRYQIQSVWRADKPQKGRYREFLQCDIDIIGSKSTLSDAEIISLYYAAYMEIGLTSLKIKINDRKQLIAAIKDNGVTSDNIFPAIQTIDKLDKKTEEEVIMELNIKGIPNGKNLIDTLSSSTPSQDLEDIMSYCEKLGVPKEAFVFSPALARGLDYYTGMIFEGIIPEYEVGSVGGGGRYDNLINDLVGVDMPAVGVAIGFDRTLEAAEVLGKIPSDIGSSKVLVTIFDENSIASSLETTSWLRQQGIATECYSDSSAKFDKQLKYADKKNIPFVIIIGPEEIEQNKIRIKNMKTGDQELVTRDSLISFLS